MALVLSLIILLLAVCVLGLWGTTNAATALTLAMTNAVQQTMMTILACTLLVMMPLLLLGAFKLGEALGEHKRASGDAARIVVPPLGRDNVPMKALPGEELPALPSGASGAPTIHVLPAPRRARSSSRARAMRIAQRWFR
jgi:hypothetical protein